MENVSVNKIGTGPRLQPELRLHKGREQPRAGNNSTETAVRLQESGAEQVAAAVSKINDFVQISRRDLQFSVDETTGLTVVKVLDSETEEVIRQIPAEEVLAIAANLEEVRGLLFRAEA